MRPEFTRTPVGAFFNLYASGLQMRQLAGVSTTGGAGRKGGYSKT